MQNETARLILVLLMGVGIALVGCESKDTGGGDSTQDPAAVDVSGRWVISTPADSEIEAVVLNQNGASLSGTAHYKVGGRVDTVSGTLTGTTVSLTVFGQSDGLAGIAITGTASGSTITGTYHVFETDKRGTFVAVRP